MVIKVNSIIIMNEIFIIYRLTKHHRLVYNIVTKSEEEKEYNKYLFIESNCLVENYKSVIRRSFGALSLIALR